MDQSGFIFPVIDAKRTGIRIKEECQRQGITVKHIQAMLGLSAFQSVYDWFSGRTIPSLDNLLALSVLLNMPMERLIVCREIETGWKKKASPVAIVKRTIAYWKELFRMKVYHQFSASCPGCAGSLFSGS